MMRGEKGDRSIRNPIQSYYYYYNLQIWMKLRCRTVKNGRIQRRPKIIKMNFKTWRTVKTFETHYNSMKKRRNIEAMEKKGHCVDLCLHQEKNDDFLAADFQKENLNRWR